MNTSEIAALRGCTPVEVALVRAAWRSGLPLALEHVPRDSADRLRPFVHAYRDLSEAERATVLRTSAVDTQSPEQRLALEEHARRLSPRWRGALERDVERVRAGVQVGDSGLARVVRGLALQGAAARRSSLSPRLDTLVKMAPDDREAWFRRVGAAALGSIREALGPRKFARLKSQVTADERPWLEVGPAEGLSPDWPKRVVELLFALAEHSATEQLRRLGIYVLVLSEMDALHADALEKLRTNWGNETAAVIVTFRDSVHRSSRRHVRHDAANLLRTLERDDG